MGKEDDASRPRREGEVALELHAPGIDPDGDAFLGGRGLRRVGAVLRLRKERSDLGVAGLLEVVVPEPHRAEGLRRAAAQHLVRDLGELLAACARRHGNRHDDALRALRADCLDGGAHGVPGGQSVVDQHHCLAAQVGQGASPAVCPLPPVQLVLLPVGRGLDDPVGDSQLADQVLVEDAHAARGERTHGQLLVPRHAELAHDEDVEGRSQPPGDLVRDRHAAAR